MKQHPKPKKPRTRRYTPGGALQRVRRAKALQRARMVPLGEQAQTIGIATRMAMKDMEQGRGSEQVWAVVTLTLNYTLALAEMGFGDDRIDAIVPALDGAFRAKLRAAKTGKWGFDGPAIQAINHALDIHDAQLELATGEEVMAARQLVHASMKKGVVYKETA